MRTILKNKKATQSTPAPEPAPAAPPKFTARGGSKKRILIAVQDNKIDFSSMSSEASKELNELLHQPDVQAQFGIGPLTDRFDPAHCKRIYEALGFAFSGMARMAKWPEPAVQALFYTEEEKTELADPTAKVLDEMAPKWLREHQALAALLLVFTSITQNKLRVAYSIAAAELLKAKRAAGSPAPAPAPFDAVGTKVVNPEVLREEMKSEMRKVGIKVPIATAPTSPDQVTLGPSGGPNLEGANGTAKQ